MMRIRNYRPEDNAAVKALHFAGIEQMREDPTIAAIQRPAGHDADLDDIENIYLKDGVFIVGVEGKEIVAMGAFKRKTAECAEFKRLRIRPDRQRQGYGETITRKLMELAVKMGYKEAFLDTLTSNYRSQALAEKWDLRRAGRGRGALIILFIMKRN